MEHAVAAEGLEHYIVEYLVMHKGNKIYIKVAITFSQDVRFLQARADMDGRLSLFWDVRMRCRL